MSRQSNDQQFCWDQILRTNRLFRVSHLFSSPQLADQLLALHALFASIELISCEITDELVALRKLSWWRAELLEIQAAQSNHPVISHLYASGALEKFPEGGLKLLLDGAEARFDALAPTDEDDFLRLCQGIYRPQLLLELAVGDTDGAINEAVLINGGLIQLLRESGRRKENAFWWIPLSLLARFNIERRELEAFHDSEVLRALFTHILESGGSLADVRLFDGQGDFVKGEGFVHLQLMIALQCRQLERLRASSPAMYSNELTRWHAGDLLYTWRRARQLNRK